MRATRRRSRPSSLAHTLLAALAISTRARAEPEPIDLVYRAYDGCPSERQFLEMVVGRAAKTQMSSEQTRGRKFRVTLLRERRETTGRLEIVASGVSASREVTGANCAEVAAALALFTALAIDPSARAEPNPEPRPDETQNAEKTEPKPADEPRPAGGPPMAPIAGGAARPAPSNTMARPSIDQDARRTQAGETIRRAPELLAGARALAAGGFEGGWATPAVGGGAALFVQLTTDGWGAYRASGAYFVDTETDLASFRFFAGRVDGCPYEARVARSLVLEPCLAFEIGRVAATAKAAPTLAPSTERKWWVAGDLVGRARFAPIPWIFAEVEAGASVPFTRYVFLLGTPGDIRGEAHRVPAIGWVLGFGLGARIL
jgi:hypothetical protein